jgi:hypothetical protein
MRKKRLSLVRKRKAIITWHYHPDRDQMPVGMKYVYMGRTKIASFSLIGFDLKVPDREVPFYDKSVATEWAKAHKWKIVEKQEWKKIRTKMLKEKGLA